MRTLRWIFLFILGILLTFAVGLNLPSVQNHLAKRLMHGLEHEYGLEVSLESFRVSFLNRASVTGFLLKDDSQDTLLFAERAEVAVSAWSLFNSSVEISGIGLYHPHLELKRLEGQEEFNFQKVLAQFNKPEAKESSGLKISIEQISMLHGDLQYFDYKDTLFRALELKEINADIGNISFHDEIVVSIRRLEFEEKLKGFKLNRFTSDVQYAQDEISVRNFYLETNRSEIEMEIKLEERDQASKSFLERYEGTVNIQSLVVNSAEFKPYFPQIPLEEEVQISGRIKGDIDRFESENLKVNLGSKSRFSGELVLENLLKPDSIYVDARVYGMVLNQSDYPGWFQAASGQKMPENFEGLGNLVFEGSLKGGLKNIKTDGALSTNFGKVDMNLSFQYDSLVVQGEYQGELALENVELGSILNNKQLGRLSMYSTVSGKGLNLDHFETDLEGEIKSLEFNGYTYTGVLLEGSLADKKFIGEVNVEEENLDFEFNGEADFSGSRPIVDATAYIDYADLYALNFYEKDSIARLTMAVDLDFQGGTLDELTGNITLSNTNIETTENYYYFSDLVVESSQKGTYRTLSVRSDMATAKIEGIYNFSGLAQAGKNMLSTYFSKYPKQRVVGLQQFNLTAEIINITPITDIFAPELTVEPGAALNGYFSTASNELRLNLNLPGIRYESYTLRRLELNTNRISEVLITEAEVGQVLVSKKLQLDSLVVKNQLWKDTASFDVQLILDDYVDAKTRVKGYATLPKPDQIKIHLDEATSRINEDQWVIQEGGEVLIQKDSILVDDFFMVSKNQIINLDGVIGPDYDDRLRLDLDSVDLLIVRPYLLASGTHLKGWADISGSVRGLSGKAIADLVVVVDSLELNKQEMGKLNLITQWDANEEKVNIDGALVNNSFENLAVHGAYFPFSTGESLDINLKVNNFKLQSISNYLKSIADPLYGKAFGDLKITGTPLKPMVKGDVKFQKANFRIPLLNVRYNIDGEAILHLENDFIEFRQFKLRDPNSGMAEIQGKIYHNKLKDIRLDLGIVTDSLLCLNTSQGSSDLYYGSAIGTGRISVSGPVNDIYMGIAAKANKGTKFSIPLSGYEKVGERSYIKFVSNLDSINSSEVVEKEEYQADLTGITLDFQLEVTPESQVEIIFDEKVGDIIRGRGYANLQLEITSLGDFNMYGDYTVTEGDYLFTLENLINKKFKVEPGGSISWNGDPYKAQLNLVAEYTTRTSLYNLQLASDTSRVKRDIELDLMVTGTLTQPEIAFNIDAPNAPDQVQNELDERLKNQNEMNTQVISLLVLNSFIQSGTGPSSYLAQAGQGFQTNTYELLSNQVSQMISQWSDRFDLGVNYRAGNERQLTSQELEVALSTQLFDDRVTINSNVGVPLEESNNNTSSLVGDVSVEVNITQDGRVRAKAFNRSNEYDPTDEQINYTQGVGIFYREEFDTVDELLNRMKARKAKRKKAREEN